MWVWSSHLETQPGQPSPWGSQQAHSFMPECNWIVPNCIIGLSLSPIQLSKVFNCHYMFANSLTLLSLKVESYFQIDLLLKKIGYGRNDPVPLWKLNQKESLGLCLPRSLGTGILGVLSSSLVSPVMEDAPRTGHVESPQGETEVLGDLQLFLSPSGDVFPDNSQHQLPNL